SASWISLRWSVPDHGRAGSSGGQRVGAAGRGLAGAGWAGTGPAATAGERLGQTVTVAAVGQLRARGGRGGGARRRAARCLPAAADPDHQPGAARADRGGAV